MSGLFHQVDEECTLHKDALLFFCYSCSKGFCYKCLYKNHNGHNVSPNSKLVSKLEKACRKADETLTSAGMFEDKLKKENIEFVKQTQSVLKKAQEDAQRCILLIRKEIARMKDDMNKIVMSNKNRFDDFQKAVGKVQELKSASSEALIACMNKECTQNPEQIFELFENLDSMVDSKFSCLPKKQTKAAIESFGFQFPRIEYKSHEISSVLGKLEWNKNNGDAEFHNSPDVAGKHDLLKKKAPVISGIENRFGHKIFLLSGELIDVYCDAAIHFISIRRDDEGIKNKSDSHDKLQQDQKSFDLILTNGETLHSKPSVQCILPTDNIDDTTERDRIKAAAMQALTWPETLERKSKHVVLSACLDRVSYGLAGLILDITCNYLEHKADDNIVTVNVIGKDEMILGILASTVDLLLTDSLKPDQSLTTTFHSGFRLEVHLGSLVEETCDAILAAVHPTLDLTIGSLSSQILSAAGQGIQKECYDNKPRPFNPGNILVTRGYNLKSKYVYHAFMGSEADILRGKSVMYVIRNAIITSLQIGLSSLAIPALGTGVGLDEHASAAMILEEIYRFAMFHSFRASLKKVVIVLQPTDVQVVKAFFDHMRALNPQLRIPMWTSIINFNSDSETRREKEDVALTLDEKNHPVTDDMKRLSLIDEFARQEPSTSTKTFQVTKAEAVKVIWLYKEKNGNWTDYPEKINAILENNYANGKEKTKWIENGKTYAVSYRSMTEEIVGSDDVVDIKRVEVSK